MLRGSSSGKTMRVHSVGGRVAVILAISAALGVLSLDPAPLHAAGALAIGKCAAYGYAYDYPSLQAAEAAARAKCTDGTCKQVVSTQKGCVAFAVDGRKPCGPNGYANGPKL